MFVINFRKGKAYPFVEMPMNELTDYVVDGELVLTNEILNMRDSLLSAPAVRQKFTYAERYLLKAFGTRLQVDPFVDYAVERLSNAPVSLTMEQLSGKIGFSRKHFIKIFKEHVGVTPKSFLKIMRFQKAIREIEGRTRVDWHTVALDTGYYDQAHFINDFRDFSGFTPKRFLNTTSDFTNYVAVG